MQPFELVIAIMIADLASVPMSDTGIPISNGIIPILALLLLQLIISIINLKSMKVREIMCRSSVYTHLYRKNRRKCFKKRKIYY